MFVIHEAHELAHTATGFALCGDWGPRDFNTWQLPEGCTTWIPTLAGPVFSYGLLLLGWLMLARGTGSGHPLGYALVLAANPFARVFTAALGGGDEGVLIRQGLGLARGAGATLVTLAVVAIICAGPLFSTWRATPPRRRPLSWIVLLLTPMAATGLILFAGFNRLLGTGWLSAPVIAGSPALVWLVTVTSAVLLAAGWRWLTTPAAMPAGATATRAMR